MKEMSPEKRMSKRQAMRAKRERQRRLQRLGVIGFIIVGALLVAFALIYPNLKSTDEIVTVEPNPRPNNGMSPRSNHLWRLAQE